MDAPQILVRDLDVTNVVRIAPQTTIQEAARLLAATGVGTLVVDSTPLSEFSEHDAVRAIALGIDGATPVCDLVQTNPCFARLDTHIPNVAAELLSTGRHSVVVLDHDDEPVGLLRLSSITTAMLGGTSWVAALRVALRVERSL